MLDIPTLSDDEDELIGEPKLSLTTSPIQTTSTLPTSPNFALSPSSTGGSDHKPQPKKKRTLPASLNQVLFKNDDDDDGKKKKASTSSKTKATTVKPKFKTLAADSLSSSQSEQSKKRARPKDDDDTEANESKKKKPKKDTTTKSKAASVSRGDKIFSGVVFTVSGIGRERAELRDKACKHGAKYLNDYDKSITHIAVADSNPLLSSDKVKSGLNNGALIVKQKWIKDCIDEGKKLPIKQYLAVDSKVKDDEPSDDEDGEDIDNIAGEDLADDWSDEDDGWVPEPEEDKDYVPDAAESMVKKPEKKRAIVKQLDQNTDQKPKGGLAAFQTKQSHKQKESDDEDFMNDEDDELLAPQNSLARSSQRNRRKFSAISQSPSSTDVKSSQPPTNQKPAPLPVVSEEKQPEWISEEANKQEVQKLYNFQQQSDLPKFLPFLQEIFADAQKSLNSTESLDGFFDNWRYEIPAPKILRRLVREKSGQDLKNTFQQIQKVYLKLGQEISGERLPEPEKPAAQKASTSSTTGPKTELPPIFNNLHFYLSNKMDKELSRKLNRLIVGHDGDIHTDFESSKHIVTIVVVPTDSDSSEISKYKSYARVVEPLFIEQSVKRKKLVDIESFAVDE